jgi:nickel/cobalt transporter (NicO) family protein
MRVSLDVVTPFAAALVGIGYGAVHGLGPDHLAALGSVLARGDRRRGLVACARFGLGHAIVLGALGAVSAVSGWLVPEAWERGAEAAGGLLLVALGAAALLRSVPLILHRHTHAHEPAEEHGDGHEHWHLHVGDPSHHRHAHPAMIGGALALSGVRSLAITVSPLLLAGRSLASALAFVIAFGLGIVASMMAFGLVFQAGRRHIGDHVSAVGIGGVSVLVGTWWIWSSLV